MSALPDFRDDGITEAVDFIGRLFGDEPRGVAMLAVAHPGQKGMTHIPLPLDRDWQTTATRQLRQYRGANCYLGVACYARPPSKREQRTTAMIAHCRWLYCERDDAPFPRTLPEPTLTVQTSAGRYQDWWQLDRPVDAATAAGYLRRIAAAAGVDDAKDAARILRIPGTINHKPERGRCMVAIVHDSGRVYTAADFDHLPAAPASRPMHDHVPDAPITENRNNYLTRRGGQLRRHGFDETVIRAALLAENTERCRPPLDDDEVAKIAHSVTRYAPAGEGTRPEPVDDALPAPVTRFPTAAREDAPATAGFHNTELGNAERLVAYHGRHIRYCHQMARWFLWDGRRWKRDEERAIERRMKAIVRDMFVAAMDESLPKDERLALIKWAFKSEARSVLRNSVDLAISDPAVAIALDDLDRDAHLLTVHNGTINLKTGVLQPHNPADFITHLVDVPYAPDAPCPQWRAFLARVLPDPDVRAFVQRAIGYSFTGETSERALLIPWGEGGTGKTTLLEAVQRVLGDYAVRTDTKTFMAQRHHDNREYAIAELLGARMVYSVEGEEDARFAEAFVKEVTGGDRLAGRHPYGRPFHFAPTHTLWLATNHRPEICGVDHAIWDRMRLIPFTQVFPAAERRPKHEVQAMFAAELPGILAFAVQGAVAWYREGLGQAEAITRANAAYRADMDILAPWIADCCVEGPRCTAAAKALRASYEAWCAVNGATPVSGTTFGKRLTGRNYTQVRTMTARSWVGIGLKSDDEPPVQQPLPPADHPAEPAPDDALHDGMTRYDAFSGTSLMRNDDLEKSRQTRHNASLCVTDAMTEGEEPLRGKEKHDMTRLPPAHAAGDAAAFTLSKERRDILNTLRAADGPLIPAVVAEKLGRNRSTIRTIMTKMAEAGTIFSDGAGGYTHRQTMRCSIHVDSVDSVDRINSVDSVDRATIPVQDRIPLSTRDLPPVYADDMSVDRGFPVVARENAPLSTLSTLSIQNRVDSEQNDDGAAPMQDIPPRLVAWAAGVLGDDWPDAEPPAWVVEEARACGIDGDAASERAMAGAILAAEEATR